MPNSPAFQFYAADYLADENVSVMTLEEEGAYWRAIAYCWREGSIPADDGRLSRLLKGASNQTLTVVRNCFNQMATDPTRLVHPRLEIEREKQRLWKEKSSAAGRLSGKARRIKKFSTEPTFVNGMNQMATKHEPNGNSSSSSSSSLKKNIRVSVAELFNYYCLRVKRNPTQYTLTEKRLAKGISRWEECLHGRTETEAMERFKKAINNLASTEYNMENGYFDWIDHLCKSTEEFEKRLNWTSFNGAKPVNNAERFKQVSLI